MWSASSDLLVACTRHTTTVDDAGGTSILPPVTPGEAHVAARVPGVVANATAATTVAYGAR